MASREVDVLMVTPYPPSRDGVATYGGFLVDALAEFVTVDVACPTPGGRERGGPTPVHPIISSNPMSTLRLSRLIRRLRPRVVHVQFSIATYGLSSAYIYLAIWLLGSRGRPMILTTVHEAKRETELLRGVGYIAYRAVGHLSSVVLVHSEESRDVMVRRCGVASNRVVHTPHGVPAVGRGADDTVGEYLLYFGFIHPDKGLALLLRAVARLVEAGVDDIRVIVAGSVRPRRSMFRLFQRRDEAHLAALQDYVRARNLCQVEFRGYVPDEEIDGLFGSARVLLLPYENVTQSGVANLALGRAKPAVATDLPGLRQDLSDAALYFAPGDVSALAAVLRMVHEDDALVTGLVAAAVRRRDEISMSKVAGGLAELYRAARG